MDQRKKQGERKEEKKGREGKGREGKRKERGKEARTNKNVMCIPNPNKHLMDGLIAEN